MQGVANAGVSEDGTTHNIDHAVWKNVIPFETYQAKDLIRIAMVGTGSKANLTTLVQFPAGATRIEAVSWDGRRTLVCGSR